METEMRERMPSGVETREDMERVSKEAHERLSGLELGKKLVKALSRASTLSK